MKLIQYGDEPLLTQEQVDHVTQLAEQYEVEAIYTKNDPDTQLQAIISVHNTNLGPGLGGARFHVYDSTLDAVEDAIRLAQGMTYKSASAGLPLGGAKAVIIKPEAVKDRRKLFSAFGEFIAQVNQVNGVCYISANDAGTGPADMDIIAEKSNEVVGTSQHQGEPSFFTMSGVLRGILASCEFKFGDSSLQGRKIAVQGLGNVGLDLAKKLFEAGAVLTVCDDHHQDNVNYCVENLKATASTNAAIYDAECDVFAPCALGAILNDDTIPRLAEAGVKVIAGAANNQLAKPEHAEMLIDAGILYAPDFVINCGGLIMAALHYGIERNVDELIDGVGASLQAIYAEAEKTKLSTDVVAVKQAREKYLNAEATS